MPRAADTIRSWTLYVLRFTDGSYYIGITAYKDFMHRVRQHGGRKGAAWARGKTQDKLVEVHPLGRLLRFEAEAIENDVQQQYRKRYGYKRVRGGYDVSRRASRIPAYTPGSNRAFFLVGGCVVVGLLLWLFLVVVAWR